MTDGILCRVITQISIVHHVNIAKFEFIHTLHMNGSGQHVTQYLLHTMVTYVFEPLKSRLQVGNYGYVCLQNSWNRNLWELKLHTGIGPVPKAEEGLD